MYVPEYINFCKDGSQFFSFSILALISEIYILTVSFEHEVGRRRSGQLTVSEGSASMTNFCCLRSCKVGLSRAQLIKLCLRTLKVSFMVAAKQD